MFRSHLYLGEIRHGKTVNLDPGFAAIIDRKLWDAVQRVRVPSGRNAKSERLLARLGVLRCASCGRRMVAGGAWATYTTAGGEVRRTRYAFYKCGRGSAQDCPAPCSITAEKLEALVLEHVKVVLADAEERESAVREAHQAADEAEAAQAALDLLEDDQFLLLPAVAAPRQTLAHHPATS